MSHTHTKTTLYYHIATSLTQQAFGTNVPWAIVPSLSNLIVGSHFNTLQCPIELFTVVFGAPAVSDALQSEEQGCAKKRMWPSESFLVDAVLCRGPVADLLPAPIAPRLLV
eukprot:5864930-Amphidinium_carterae.1